jgi:hypothetical protein
VGIAEDVTAHIDVNPRGVEIAVHDLWDLARLLFLRDFAAGRTKVCANEDCGSRYFLEQRKGQKFCSHNCAVLINVRRFRSRQVKAQEKKRGIR